MATDGDLSIVRISNEPIQYETMVLDKIKMRATQQFSSQFIESMELHRWNEFAADTMVLALEALVLAEKLAEKEQYIYEHKTARFWFPSSPWQHFKSNRENTRWLGWFVRRWPVKRTEHKLTVDFEKTITIDQFALFPASPIRTPENIRGPIITRFEQTRVED